MRREEKGKGELTLTIPCRPCSFERKAIHRHRDSLEPWMAALKTEAPPIIVLSRGSVQALVS